MEAKKAKEILERGNKRPEIELIATLQGGDALLFGKASAGLWGFSPQDCAFYGALGCFEECSSIELAKEHKPKQKLPVHTKHKGIAEEIKEQIGVNDE